MKVYPTVFLLASLVSLAAHPAFCEDSVYKIDTAQSVVRFTFKNMKVKTTAGELHGVSGSVHYDSKNPGATSVEVHVDPKTLATQLEKLDAKLKGKDFLDVDENRDLVYKSTQVEPDEHGGFAMRGKLRMHGVEQQVDLLVLPVRTLVFDETGERSRITTTAVGELNRRDFAMYGGRLDRGGLQIGDQVKFEAEVQLLRQKAD